MPKEQTHSLQEDEIDLRELFRTLVKNKKMIVIITLTITLLATIYAYLQTPIYEVKAFVKVGEYKTEPAVTTTIGIPNELIQELSVLYINTLKNAKNKGAWIDKIEILKKQENIFEISAQGLSNDLAIEEINKVVTDIQTKHKEILEDIKNFRSTHMKQTEEKLVIFNTKILPELQNKILKDEESVRIYENNFETTQANLQKVKSTNPGLASLQIDEQTYLVEMLIDLKNSLENLKTQKQNIEVSEVFKLQKELIELQSLTEPSNYKNSQIIGNIIASDYPVKPKKRLIVTVAFVSGFILSVFLVFFLNFIRSDEAQ